jgi:TPR repeat protein
VLMYRLNGKNEVLSLVIFFLVILAIQAPVCAQDTTGLSRVVQVGDTFTISRPVNSSFHSWELADYDVRRLSLLSKRPADTIGEYHFTFEALEPGQSDLVFERFLNTALRSERVEELMVSVTIKGGSIEQTENTGEDTPGITSAPITSGTSDTSEEFQPTDQGEEAEQTDNAPQLDWSEWDHAQEMIETENYQEARKLIQKQAVQASGEARYRWKQLEAQSYMEQKQYGNAIGVWEGLVKEFPSGPQAKWLLSIAKAHQNNDAPGQAELALLKIRHRHAGSPQWPTAMKRLAQLARERGEYKRARKILVEARSRLSMSAHPDILMELAEIYDKFSATRNYYKAVKLYRKAAMNFDQSDTRSQQASKRAQYLRNNFLDFGIQ